MDNNKHIPLRTIEATPSLNNLDRLCDMEEGRLSGKVFWDEAIYEQEMEKIFARCWVRAKFWWCARRMPRSRSFSMPARTGATKSASLRPAMPGALFAIITAGHSAPTAGA
ncbi:3-phenylpropionate/cinnamic acid dioxygenase subunit alpha [compost metagenome]